MSDDIAACPHSLAERETAVADGMCPICSADAISRRSTPPLPDEIAGLIDHAKQYFHIITRKEMAGEFPQIGLPTYIEKIASALRAVALENEIVSTENDTIRESVNAVRAEYLQRVFDEKARADELEAKRDAANDRIRGLEAACDGITELLEPTPDELAIGDGYTFAKMKIEKLKAERDAIRAKIESIANDYEAALKRREHGDIAAHKAVESIRALAQTDEGKTETGE